ncbi:NAD(P)-dependent alcohol dehydrogenase [Holophaga foetida]|uniref:NAD(P)-dependent alcohol dehydrogenase n=1 Tax=Holophaga foetida TaxID=35839 RepID=UPI000247376B|nr:NAD(P)-dependent alcohol dehydrogenase [Holophaga foetida]
MKITAAVVHEKSGPFRLESVELDEPREDEILVRIVGCGVCHTDLVARDQHLPVPLPAVFGHEGSGVVERVGSRVTKVQPGDHVVMSYLTCGTCPSCLKGMPSHCPSFLPLNVAGVRPDGTTTLSQNGAPVRGSFFGQSSFATYALARERNVVKVSKEVPLEILGPLGCGVQTGAGGVLNSLKPPVGSSIVVFGAGSVGMSAVLAAQAAGCAVIIAVDIQPERLRQAAQLGATHTLNPKDRNPVEEIRRITGIGADYSLECTALPQVLRQAVDCLRVGGTCGLIGVAAPGVEVALEMATLLDGRTIKGIVEGDSNPDIFIPQLIELYRQGKFPFDRLIRTYSLDQINQAVEDSEKGRVLKAIVRP